MDGSDDVTIRLAATFYAPGQHQTGLLRRFAEDVAAGGWRIGGIVQELMLDEQGDVCGLDAIMLDTGDHIAINRPTASDRLNHTCSLDKSALAEASGAVDRAIGNGVDLIIIEKFGEQEQKGEGLSHTILRAASGGIPTIVAVPEGVRHTWQVFSGGLGQDLDYEFPSFQAWWNSVKCARQI